MEIPNNFQYICFKEIKTNVKKSQNGTLDPYA